MVRQRKFYLKALLFLNLFFLEAHTTKSQSILGFWEVKEVTVGDKVMTPVAKWTKIHEDGTFQSGNGWLQNAEGTWQFDSAPQAFLLRTRNGIRDEFGAFTVSFSADTMIWKRQEEGMPVTVRLVPIKELPKSTADYLQGLWSLVEVEKEGASEYDPRTTSQSPYLVIRWDRIYVERDAEGQRKTGYWHINGHRPEITLLSHDQDKEPESWRVSVSDQALTLTGISDNNREAKYHYRRMDAFPE